MVLEVFEICSIVIVLSAFFGYVNVKFLKLPNTIGLMIVAIAFTAFLFASTYFTSFFLNTAEELIAKIDFQHILLEVMLGFLLFAGALHTNFDQLHVQRWPILIFATLGVLASMFICAAATYYGFGLLGINVKFIHCMLFGALISPTDPIAVLGILKRAGVPKKLETKIVGESLFNDGVGVVVFMTIYGIASGGLHPGESRESLNATPTIHAVSDGIERPAEPVKNENSDSLLSGQESEHQPMHEADEHTTLGSHAPGGNPFAEAIKSFIWEVFGGLALGSILGYGTFLLLRSIDDYEIEIMITLACVMGGYSLAMVLHFSAPLAIVVAGLIVGNDTVRGTAMSKQTETYVDKFWELLDIMLNAILFVLIGLEILILTFNQQYLYAAAMAIVIVLMSRYLSLIIPVRFFSKRLDFVPFTTVIMTWGGLRGGISIALALSMTPEMNRDLFLTVTYGVVIFSIVVQGLSLGGMARRLIGSENPSELAHEG